MGYIHPCSLIGRLFLKHKPNDWTGKKRRQRKMDLKSSRIELEPWKLGSLEVLRLTGVEDISVFSQFHWAAQWVKRSPTMPICMHTCR